MLGDIYSRPASQWRRIHLPALTRQYRTPRVLDEQVELRGYDGLPRRMTVIEWDTSSPPCC